MKTKKYNKTKKSTSIALVEYDNFEHKLIELEKHENKTNEQIKKQFIKTLLTPYSKTSYLPNQNFYNYVNNSWLKETNLTKTQEYLTQIDNYKLVQDNVYGELHNIIKDYIKNNNNNFSKQLHNFYTSCLNFNKISSSKKIINEIIETIDNLRKDKNNLWKLLGMINKNHIVSAFSPFKWGLYPDKKEPNIFRVYLNTYRHSVIISSIINGNKNDPIIKEQIKQKTIYLKETFKYAFGKKKNVNNHVKNIFNIEHKLYNLRKCNNENENESCEYNRVTRQEAIEKYNFNWDELSKELGFKTPPPFFIINNLDFLKSATKLLLEEWDTEEWRSFWLMLYFRAIVRFTEKWRGIYFNYYGKFQKGLKGFWYDNDKVKSSILMSYPFGHFLSKSYSLKFSNYKTIEFIQKIGEDLKLVFIKVLGRNNWLSAKTKKYAIEKIKLMNFFIGKKETDEEIDKFDDSNLEYSPTEFYKNMTDVTTWRDNKFISLEGKQSFEIIHLDWIDYPVTISGPCSYVVNAYYQPIRNAIFIPLGYIQSPFVDLNNKGFEYNLANIGFTIAHELSHALDNIGGKYGINGALYDWWEESDKKKYDLLQKDVLNQYNEFAAKDGIKYNSKLSLSEDLADISGLAICEEYLRDYFENNNIIAPIKYLKFREFYNYFAYQMRQKIPKSAINTQLLTNPHPPDIYRTNVPLSRSETFRACFDVKKGDGMWWHNTNTIW